MRVLMLGSLPPDYGGKEIGGLAVHTAKLALHLATMGVSVTVLAGNLPFSQQAITRDGFAIYPLAGVRSKESLAHLLRKPWSWLGGSPARHVGAKNLRLSRRHRLATSLLAAQYDHFLARVRPDIAHVHGGGLGLLAASFAARRRNIPAVATMHSLRGHLPDQFFFDCVVPSLNDVDTLISVSEALREEAKEYGISETKIKVVYNGVDTDYFRPLDKAEACARLGICSGTSNVLFVGHLIRRKGVDLLIRAFAQVAAQNQKARLFIVGGPVSYTESSWYEGLLTLPGQLGISDRVFFVGPVESHQEPTLNLWYNAADVVVLPSRAEGMGLVLIEAMACGKPVIGARVGGIQNIIKDGYNGLLAAPEDVEGLACAIKQILDHPQNARNMGQTAQAEAVASYSWSQVAKRTLQIYHDALQPAE